MAHDLLVLAFRRTRKSGKELIIVVATVIIIAIVSYYYHYLIPYLGARVEVGVLMRDEHCKARNRIASSLKSWSDWQRLGHSSPQRHNVSETILNVVIPAKKERERERDRGRER